MHSKELAAQVSLNGKTFVVKVVNDSLLKTDVEAIVNAANCEMRGGGGINGAIQKMAGPRLLESLEKIAPNGCPTGEVVVTTGFETGFKHIFHTPGPVWKGGDAGEAELLSNSYWNCLNEANTMKLKSIGFCSISTGIYGYPLQDGANIAMKTLVDYVSSSADDIGVFNLNEVIFAMYTENEYNAFIQAFNTIFIPWVESRAPVSKNLSWWDKIKNWFKELVETPSVELEQWNDHVERELLQKKEREGRN